MRKLAQHTLGVLVNACIFRTLVTKRWQEVGGGASLEEVGHWGQVLGADLVLASSCISFLCFLSVKI